MNYHSKLPSPRDSCQYQIGGPYTYRRGCRMILKSKYESDHNNIGGNRANIEKGMRKIWIADPGFELCQVDQSGAEALAVAYLCKDAKYRALFKNGIKPHHYICLKLFPDVWKDKFGKDKIDCALKTEINDLISLNYWNDLCDYIESTDEWEPKKRYYYMGKKTIHSFSYGQRENSFRTNILKETAGTVNLSFDEAKHFRTTFFAEFPEILDWHQRVFREAKTKRQLRNLLGFPYNITDFVDENDYKDLIAWIPQSTIACITLKALVAWQEYVWDNNLNWHLLHETHDSFLTEAPKDENLENAKKMKEFIEQELVSPLDGSVFRMKSSVAVGLNWSSYKEKYNEEGLKKIKL